MKLIAQKMFEQAIFNSPLGVEIAWNTTVGGMASASWLALRTVAGSMTITIDYGDGTTKAILCTETTTGGSQNHTYGAGFGVGVEKTMKLIIPDRFNVSLLSIAGSAGSGSANSPTGSGGPIPVELNRLPNLSSLILNSHNFTDIPASILDLANLTVVNCPLAYGGDPTLYDNFPDKILYKEDGSPRGLTTLGHSIRFHGDGSHVGYERLDDLAATLDSLNTQHASSGVTDFPAEILNLINLKTLFYNQSGALTQLPTIINSLTTLERINIGVLSGITNMSNLPALVNLISIDLRENGFNTGQDLNVTIAQDWINYTKLKTLGLLRCFATSVRADDFVNDFYDVVVAYAPVVGTSADQFRSMTVDFRLNGTLTGIFQQPVGYSAGVSNGSPASPQEKRWVLVNQYAHVWTM